MEPHAQQLALILPTLTQTDYVQHVQLFVEIVYQAQIVKLAVDQITY